MRKRKRGLRAWASVLTFLVLPGAALTVAPANAADSGPLPLLYEVYRDHFLIGSVFSQRDFNDGARFDLIKRHFNVMTAENAMKPSELGGWSKGAYNFGGVDNMLASLEEADIRVHGHVLVWHSQSAMWLNMNPDWSPLTRAEARANMEEYINAVAGHYAGRVISWDVVNEAFQDSVNVVPADWRDALRKHEPMRGSPWFRAYENGADSEAGESGADYIYDAFVFARLADPGAVLYYNDFNETERGKREAIAMMAEELNAKWRTDPRNTEPDRLLIEGLGMQAHYWTDNLNPQDVEDTIRRWAETGAEISVSELDIPAGRYGQFKALDEEEERKQARLYAELFLIFKRHSGSIARVTFWGIDDPSSWRREGSPLLFDGSLAPKQAFYAVADPEGYLAGNYDGLDEAETAPAEMPSPPAGEDGNALRPIWPGILLAGGIVLGALIGGAALNSRRKKKRRS